MTDKTPSTPKDFNDLHQLAGLAEVHRQLFSGLSSPGAGAVDSPAPPAPEATTKNEGGQGTPDLETSGPLTVDQCVERFQFVTPNGHVFDTESHDLLKPATAKALMRPKIYDGWLLDNRRKDVRLSDVKPLVFQAEARERGLAATEKRYVLLYGSSEVWDKETQEVMHVNAMRLARADCFDMWIKSPSRQEIHRSKLVFDPTCTVDTTTHINRFRGLPMTPERNDDKCQAIIDLALHLCNGRYREFHWLMCWLSYPLQNVGAKMDTAILMHSPQEGTGKSLLFDGVVKTIYGEYGATVGQHQLESQYSDWRSCKLFALFEEVLSRDQKFNYTGALKYMITGATQRLEQKFLASWEEANHMNSVFLSNEIQPWPLDNSDRRMHVLWPMTRLDQSKQRAVQKEIDSGGIEAFYAFLLEYPLKWPDESMLPDLDEAVGRGNDAVQGFINALPANSFDTRTKPPMTQEKLNLIECGRPSWEVFFRDWLDGVLEVPVMPCLVEDLFQVFRRWADSGLENKVSQHKFSNYAAKIPDLQRRKDVRYTQGQSERKGRFFVPLALADDKRPRVDETQSEYFGRCAQQFRSAAGLNGD